MSFIFMTSTYHNHLCQWPSSKKSDVKQTSVGKHSQVAFFMKAINMLGDKPTKAI